MPLFIRGNVSIYYEQRGSGFPLLLLPPGGWSGDFVLSVSREFVQSCNTPLLVLPGINLAHPTAIGREIASLAPRAELLEPWKEPAELVPHTVERIRRFLRSHTPA